MSEFRSEVELSEEVLKEGVEYFLDTPQVLKGTFVKSTDEHLFFKPAEGQDTFATTSEGLIIFPKGGFIYISTEN